MAEFASRIWRESNALTPRTCAATMANVFDPELQRRINDENSYQAWRAAQEPRAARRTPLAYSAPPAFPATRHFYHPSQLADIAFSPDASLLATAGHGGKVRLWRTTGSADPLELDVNDHYVNAVAFSPDGSLLATAGPGGTVWLWRTAGAIHCATLRGHTNYVNSLAFSPDGRLLASAAQEPMVRIWRIADLTLQATLDHRDNKNDCALVYAVAFSPDGALLMTSDNNGTVRLWQCPRSPGLAEHASTESSSGPLTRRPGDGRTGGPRLRRSRSAAASRRAQQGGFALEHAIQRQSIHVRPTFGSRGLLATVDWFQGEVQLWRITDGTLEATLGLGHKGIRCLAASPSGLLACGSEGCTTTLSRVRARAVASTSFESFYPGPSVCGDKRFALSADGGMFATAFMGGGGSVYSVIDGPGDSLTLAGVVLRPA